MQTSDEGTLTRLRLLLRITEDSEQGYVTAEQGLSDIDLVRELEKYRKERSKIAAELRKRIRDLRGDPDVGTTAVGALHRRLIEVRAEHSANPTEAVLSEVERGEDVAVDAFRAALRQTDIDALSRKALEHHYELVQAAHDRVKQLRDRLTCARA